MEERAAILHWLHCYYEELDKNPHDEIEKMQDENIAYMRRVIEMDHHLAESERKLLERVYSSKINLKRKLIERLRTIEIPEKYGKPKEVIDKLIEGMTRDIRTTAEGGIKFIEKFTGISPEEEVYYEQWKASMYLQMLDAASGPEQAGIMSECAQKCYRKGIEIAKGAFDVTAPEYLDIMFHYILFMYNVLNKKEEALLIAKKTHADALDVVVLLDEPMYSKTVLRMHKYSEMIARAGGA